MAAKMCAVIDRLAFSDQNGVRPKRVIVEFQYIFLINGVSYIVFMQMKGEKGRESARSGDERTANAFAMCTVNARTLCASVYVESHSKQNN